MHIELLAENTDDVLSVLTFVEDAIVEDKLKQFSIAEIREVYTKLQNILDVVNSILDDY